VVRDSKDQAWNLSAALTAVTWGIAGSLKNKATRDALLLPSEQTYLHFSRHKIEKLWEVDGSVAVRVYFVDHILQLGFCWILSQGTHHRPQLLGCDAACESQQQKHNDISVDR